MSATPDVQPVAVAQGEGSVAIAAPVRGSMIVTGDNNTVEMNFSGVGAVLTFVFRWDRPRPRRRRDRRDSYPPPFGNHVDRENDVAALLPIDDDTPRIVNVYGAAGIGKTHVLVEALNRNECAMHDGAVYLDGGGQSTGDLLHAIFDELYECRVQRRDLHIERLLRSRRAVVALEDVELLPDAAQRLVLGAPRCRFLVTSPARVLFEGTPVPLAGLAPEYAVAIAEQELGRPLGPQERRTAETIAATLDGHPLGLRQAFSRARDEGRGRPLDELESEPWLMAVPTAADRLATMTPQQLRAARALAVHGGASLGDEHLRAIAGAEAVAAAAELEARHDAISHSPRHSLVGVLARTLPQDDLAEETDRALEHFTGWTETHAGDSEALLREAAALLALLERAHAAGRWPEVIRLGRAIEGAYALGQRWAGWGRVLELVLDAARQREDLEAEGWARHQLGTRSYGLGQLDDARASLQDALALRERIGDSAGAAATRQNLRVVSGRPPLLYRLSHLSLTVVAIICVLLIGAGVAGAGIIAGGGQPGVAELVVNVQGAGRVVSDDASISCADAECRDQVTADRELVLRARPQRGWEFARWDGACSGRSTCRLLLTGGTHVVAVFNRVDDPREVTVSVQGEGTVVSHPAGIACHADQDCQATFTRSRRLELTAAAAPGHRFAGWSRDCDGTRRCIVTADTRRTTVHARFVADATAVTLTVDARGDGLGRVTSRQSGIDCGELCATSYRRGTRVVLSAIAQPGSSFDGWSDAACTTATRNTCTIALDHSRNVVARFAQTARAPDLPGGVVTGSSANPGDPVPQTPANSYLLTVLVNGQGTVSSRPAGIGDCARQCSAAFPEGQRIVLTATAREGSSFPGWTDPACTTPARDTCIVSLDRSRDISVRFESSPGASAPAPRRPAVRIDAPTDGSKYSAGESIRYSATASDPQDGRLPDDAIVWREDDTVIGRGPKITRTDTSIGTHTIKVTATNSQHLSDSDSISITVRPNAPPRAQITSPSDNAEFETTGVDAQGAYRPVQFTAEASDPDGNPLTYRWTDRVDGGSAENVSTELSPLLRLHSPLPPAPRQPRAVVEAEVAQPSCGTGSHALTLAVSDGTATTTATVTVRIFTACPPAPPPLPPLTPPPPG
jgi:hypothetical protein